MSGTTNPHMPDIITDLESSTQYKCECYLGKGGFAKCYQVIDLKTQKSYACKIISKQDLKTDRQKTRNLQEILIHQPLKHNNIVNFHSHFEDSKYTYIILELCKNRSMAELHKRRRTITEYECRYYMYQIIEGMKYLHENKIIHRDIKLGNIFLNDDLNVKIGDFGLAAQLKQSSEIRKTFCGTPNFVAPEVLNKQGHSFEADIWSLGCLMYTLLIGKPPFETNEIEITYEKIRKGSYFIPQLMEKSAIEMIDAMLQPKPKNRPKIDELLNFKFMTIIAVPTSLPFSCLTVAPRLTAKQLQKANLSQRKALTDKNTSIEIVDKKEKFKENSISQFETTIDYQSELEYLQHQLRNLINSKAKIINLKAVIETNEPAAQPLFWISKWIDYSPYYGFAYQLCTNQIGAKFNDRTHLILFPNGIDLQYIDKEGKEIFMTTTNFSKAFEKKITLMTKFKKFMKENLLATGENSVLKKSDEISRLPYLNAWLRADIAIIMQLTNGTVQLNFDDHVKLILCPRMGAVTYINENNDFYTHRFSTIIEKGFSHDLFEKILLANKYIGMLLREMK